MREYLDCLCRLALPLIITATACGGSSPAGPSPPPSPPAVLTWSLLGSVTESGEAKPITNATVRVQDGPNAGRTTTTDSNGAYTLLGLDQAGFTVVVTAPGYVEKAEGVSLTADRTLHFELSRSSEPLSFFFDGAVGEDCFLCTHPSDKFGTGVAPGTRLSGRFTFVPTTRQTPITRAGMERAMYFGVTVEVTVGSETMRGNRSAQAWVEIANGPPMGDSYSVIVQGPLNQPGFTAGTIAGRRINDFYWVVSATSTLFSDLSLPLNPAFFNRALHNSRVCIGDCFPRVGERQILEGAIRDLGLTPP